MEFLANPQQLYLVEGSKVGWQGVADQQRWEAAQGPGMQKGKLLTGSALFPFPVLNSISKNVLERT